MKKKDAQHEKAAVILFANASGQQADEQPSARPAFEIPPQALKADTRNKYRRYGMKRQIIVEFRGICYRRKDPQNILRRRCLSERKVKQVLRGRMILTAAVQSRIPVAHALFVMLKSHGLKEISELPGQDEPDMHALAREPDADLFVAQSQITRPTGNYRADAYVVSSGIFVI